MLFMKALLQTSPSIRLEEELQRFIIDPSRIQLVRVWGEAELKAADRVCSLARSRSRGDMPRNAPRRAQFFGSEKKMRAAFRFGRRRTLLIVIGRASGSAVVQVMQSAEDPNALTLFFQGGGLTSYQGNLSEVLRKGYPFFRGNASVTVRWATQLLRRLIDEMEPAS